MKLDKRILSCKIHTTNGNADKINGFSSLHSAILN